MTLNFISWMPEVFFLVTFLGMLCYGITPGASPLSEQWAVPLSTCTKTDRIQQNQTSLSAVTLPVSGPVHSSFLLGAWAIPWCVLGFLLVFYCPLQTMMAGGVFVRDLLSLQLGSLLWFFAAAVLMMTLSWQKIAGIVHPEYVTLTLLALLGQHLLLYAIDLMSFYICLELQSFAIVVLCSLNYSNAYSLEAGCKYFLLSAFSSCLLLLGIGLIYWETGITQCNHLTELLNTTYDEPSLSVWLGIWLVSLGLLWKLSAAPLHLWVADVYLGSWSSVTLFISTLPKIAIFGFWIHTWHSLWSATFGSSLALFSTLSLMIGALAPFAQTQLKRLLAFSSVGHIGFMLIPLVVGVEAFGALWVYLLLYLITSLAIWGLILCQFQRPGALGAGTFGSGNTVTGPQFIWDLSFMHKTSPAAAMAWAITMLSLAGLPPVTGFLGKLAVFWCALNSHLYTLVAVALVSTLVSTVYYLRILKVAYVDAPKNWGIYGQMSSMNAYLISIACGLLVLLLWHGAPLLLSSHLVALACC